MSGLKRSRSEYSVFGGGDSVEELCPKKKKLKVEDDIQDGGSLIVSRPSTPPTVPTTPCLERGGSGSRSSSTTLSVGFSTVQFLQQLRQSCYASFLEHTDPLRFIRECPKTLVKVDVRERKFMDPFIFTLDLLEKEFLDDGGQAVGFYCNRASLLAAFCAGNFYFLELDLSAEAINCPVLRDAFDELKEDLFQVTLEEGNMSEQHLLSLNHYAFLPCFCTTSSLDQHDDGSTFDVEFLWVHPKFRRLGLGRFMMEALSVTHVDLVLKDSLPFWNSLGVVYSRVS
jgi:GNAT superfamily N-acetyltransferase